jgi:transposase
MATEQGQLFPVEATDSGIVFVSERCRLQTQDGYRVVTVSGVVLAHYTVEDRMSEALAMVNLVDQGWAQQKEVARAFGCSERTVRRYQQRFDSGGLQALGRASGYPKGRARLPATRTELVNGWKEEGVSQREISRRLGVNEKAVRKLLRRLGWKEEQPEQLSFGNATTDPELSGSGQHLPEGRALAVAGAGADAPERSIRPGSVGADPNLSGPVQCFAEATAVRPAAEAVHAAEGTPPVADPNLSASAPLTAPWLPRSLDANPSDRRVDRLLACLGLLDDAAPLFAAGSGVAGVGVLLALPAIVESGVIRIAREIYGSLGPAFYGLRTTLVTLLLMALLRIKRPEALKEHSPKDLGRILGLDRAPEVKTLRRKLARLASYGRAGEFGHALAERRVATRGHAMGFLYLDGHVRAYHGKRSIPKTHVARMRISMPATTDYWVNDAEGEPLFVVTTEANKGLVKMLPEVLKEVRSLVAERRVTVVFDRGGWSPKLFQKLMAEDFDFITYRKGRSRRVAKSRFAAHQATLDGRKLHYLLADQNVLLLKRKLRLRQVTRLSCDGHQTRILTSRWDLPAIEVAYRMFERWRQENFFKYLREEYALDVLVDYAVEPAEPVRSVPNPKRKELDAELHRARAHLAQLEAEFGLEALENPESRRRTMRGFKIAHSMLAQRVRDAMKRVATLEKRRARVPARVPVQEVVEGEVIKLAVERKHLTNLLKMVAYQAEGDLLRILAPHYRRSDDEGRTLVQNALASTGDIEVTETELRVSLRPLSSPHRTHALAALCEQLNKTNTRFPGSRLRLHFTAQKEPSPSMAFPGPRPSKSPSESRQPDNQNAG